MKKDKDYIIKEFIENAIIQGNATLDGDFKKGNKASDKLYKITTYLKDDHNFAKEILDTLLVNNEPNVLVWACGLALDINYRVVEAEKLLTELSNRSISHN